MIDTLLRPLLLALTMLTALPLPGARAADSHADPRQLSRALLTYPLVGLLLGALLVGACWALFDLPPLAAAAIVLALWVVLTGARHVQDLATGAQSAFGRRADSVDLHAAAHAPGGSPVAVVAVVLLLIGKFAGLAAALDHGNLLSVLLAPALGRTALLAVMCIAPERGDTAGAGVQPPRQAAWLVVAAVGALGLLLAPGALMLAVLGTAALGHSALARHQGGRRGIHGTAVELIETATLLVMALPPDA